jgi:hypothetical protein
MSAGREFEALTTMFTSSPVEHTSPQSPHFDLERYLTGLLRLDPPGREEAQKFPLEDYFEYLSPD